MLVSGIADYIKNKEALKNHTFVYTASGDKYYIVAGKKITIEQMKKKFPLNLQKKNYKGESIDGRRIK